MIYLDHAATTRVHPEVVREMLPYFENWYGNPSSGYEFGRESKAMIEQARKEIADSLRGKPEEIYFTSGGTEADNWVIFGIAESLKGKGRHIITSQIEHHALLRSCEELEKRGYEVTYLPVDSYGVVDREALARSIRPDTILISIMYANNEIGTIQPVREIGMLARQHQVYFHTDGVQAYMHEPVDVQRDCIDLFSASSHKFQGPKGVGFLYARKGIGLPSWFYGGGQENRMRAGTENVPGIVGMAKAVSLGRRNMEEERRKLGQMQSFVMKEILRRIPEVRINGSASSRLKGNVHVSFKDVEGQSLLILMDMEEICLSSGSACSTGEEGISHVLQGIGLPEEYARGSIRITMGPENTMEEMSHFLRRLESMVRELRGQG